MISTARRFDDTGLEVLSPVECLRLLRTVPFGRLVFTEGGLPAVRLVNFFVDGDTLVYSTASGEKLRAAQRGDVVAFEVDDVDLERHLGWTATAVGHLSVVPDDERPEVLRTIPLHSWAPHSDKYLIRLGLESLTGRRLVAWGQRHAQ
ncbi:pyridoxamine 5'-phosphate oxidase-like protein [Kribbella steppae]|uniref:Pyridoxamine 5'-phosphate oxidase-like protein n=1 Tax=Kribbella steppae TaxID=2512223 RepID=A0A4R2H4K6_9ACTN|nr:pyridoxamine 5'-phosphate oxidase family protein [Kribbella steppae]TCO20396.1 pyridoxamine 5'-phosphate oxidase-like protein [Kribbella steppae]